MVMDIKTFKDAGRSAMVVNIDVKFYNKSKILVKF